MKSSSAKLVVAAGLVYVSFAIAQPPAPQPPGQRPPTIEERVAALERGLASVTTRFDIREAAVTPAQSSGGALDARLSTLERSLERMQQDMQRLERAADNAQRSADAASRAADDARRTAMDAERNAQNALLRAH